MQDLVVLIPGIMGSVLRKDGADIWGGNPAAMGTAVLSLGRSLRESLSLAGDDPDVDDLGDGVSASRLVPGLHFLPGLSKIMGYGHVGQSVVREFDLIIGRNYHEFAYDWRRDNRVCARQLARKCHDWLRGWRNESPEARVIILAHSMGGLVARYWLEVLGGWNDGDVRALITFGTPFRGSLKALDTLANGVHKGPIPLHHLTAMSRTLTSIYQLLPIYPAFDAGDGQLVRLERRPACPTSTRREPRMR